MSDQERAQRGIGTLPGNLSEAIALAEKSDLVRGALGEYVFTTFIENKKREWGDYNSQVTDYELERYLPIL